MQTIALDLKNNPDLKSLIADMNPGDKIELVASIKSKDDQSVTLTVETASEATASESEAADKPAEEAMEKEDTKTDGVIPDES
jgi:hypothetical protein